MNIIETIKKYKKNQLIDEGTKKDTQKKGLPDIKEDKHSIDYDIEESKKAVEEARKKGWIK